MNQSEHFEKQAFLAALLKQLAGKGLLPKLSGLIGQAGRGAKSLGATAAKKSVIPAAAAGAGAGGYALGNSHGYSAGDTAGYGRGSAEGGVNATRNLFKGLMDLQQQGAKSKSSLQTLMPKQGSVQNPEFMSHTERRKLRIKIAQHVLHMDALKSEMDKYNLDVLQKAASAGVNKKQRIKYAALVRQYELEKQAFIGGLARLAGKGLLSGAKMLGRGAMAGGRAGMAGARAAAPHVGRAMQAGAQTAGRGALNAGKGIARMAGGATAGGLRGAAAGVRSGAGTAFMGGMRGAGHGAAQAAKANPLQAMLGTGAVGLGLGTQLPSMYRGINRMGRAGRNMMADGARELTGLVSQGQEGIDSAYENVGNFMNTIGQAGQDIYGGFQQAGNRF